MGRKRRIQSWVLSLAFVLTSCNPSSYGEYGLKRDVEIRIADSDFITKSYLPDETHISDINILIYDRRGDLTYNSFIKEQTCKASLIIGETYTICACVNFGHKVIAQTLEELKNLEFHLAYPDEYKGGIPMCALLKNHLIAQEGHINLEPVRLMSKISIRLDRSKLNKGIDMIVTGLRIGNCPKKVKVFENSRITSGDECFNVGFSLDDAGCYGLNRENTLRQSESVSLYMLENMQGSFSETGLTADMEKVFEEYDVRREVCSYIEIDMDYSSGIWHSDKAPLRYRFYLGENLNSLDIQRNCHYHITVCPEDDGLKGEGWRVDKSGLKYISETSLEQYPADYIVGNIGEKIHIGCIVTPAEAPFDIGRDYLEADKASGIYDYEIDADGHGVTLTLTGPGRGLIYMEAGAPVDDAVLFIIEVNRP